MIKRAEIIEKDNVNKWKQKEFKRLFPNSLFSTYVEMAWHFGGLHQTSRGFDLRKFKKEYND